MDHAGEKAKSIGLDKIYEYVFLWSQDVWVKRQGPDFQPKKKDNKKKEKKKKNKEEEEANQPVGREELELQNVFELVESAFGAFSEQLQNVIMEIAEEQDDGNPSPVFDVQQHFKTVMSKVMTITDLSFCLLSDSEFFKVRKGVNEMSIQMLEDYFVALYDEQQSKMPVSDFVIEMIKYFEHQSRTADGTEDYIVVYRNTLKGPKKEEKKEELDPMKRMKEQIKQTKESYLALIEHGKVTDEAKRQAILNTIEVLDRQIFQLENGIEIEVMVPKSNE